MRRWDHAPDVHDGWADARIAVGTLLLAGCLGAGVIATYRYGRIWTPLQRHYLWAYAWSGVAPTHEGDYAVARIVDRSGQRLALDADLVTVTTATGERSFALSDAAVKAGATRLDWAPASYHHADLHASLRRRIYGDQAVADLARPAVWGGLALFLGGLLGARVQERLLRRGGRDPFGMRWGSPAEPTIVRYVDVTPPSSAHPSHPVPGRRAVSAPDARTPAGLRHGDQPRAAASAETWPEPPFK